MSVKDDPVAFFPSIDRDLLRDLDRHFRAHLSETSSEIVTPERETPATSPSLSVDHTNEPETPSTERPTADDLVIAVQRTAAALTDRTDRIEELERDLDDTD